MTANNTVERLTRVQLHTALTRLFNSDKDYLYVRDAEHAALIEEGFKEVSAQCACIWGPAIWEMLFVLRPTYSESMDLYLEWEQQCIDVYLNASNPLDLVILPDLEEK